MIIDIAAPDSYLMINKKAINILGLECATYFTVLLNIGKTVVRKKRFDEEGFFIVDRKFVLSETSLSTDKQKKNDLFLSKYGFLEVHEKTKNKIRLHADKYAELVATDQSEVEKQILFDLQQAEDEKPVKKVSKKVEILGMLKAALNEADLDTKEAFDSLLEVLYEKGLTKKIQVQYLESQINQQNLTKESKIQLLHDMTLLGYKDPQWLLDKDPQHIKYKKEKKIFKNNEKAIVF